MRNTGKPAELDWEIRMRASYRKLIIHRLTDSHKATAVRAARSGRTFRQSMVLIEEQPADYVVVTPKNMFFAEVKSFSSNRFPFRSLRRSQTRMGELTARVNPETYLVFLRHEPTLEWWLFPYATLIGWRDGEGLKSISTQELNDRGTQWRLS
jgi:penicillin-binding protein-related factor A (putative recombinase)